MNGIAEQGGWVLAAIGAVSLLAWYLLLGQWMDLLRCARSCRGWERTELRPGDGPRIREAEPRRFSTR